MKDEELDTTIYLLTKTQSFEVATAFMGEGE